MKKILGTILAIAMVISISPICLAYPKPVVSIVPNGGSGYQAIPDTTTPNPSDQYAIWNITIPSCTLTPPAGKEFDTWTLSADNTTKPVAVGSTWGCNTYYTTQVKLYAGWKDIFYTITFNTNGGTTIATQSRPASQNIPVPTPPTRNGYIFNGWYIDSGLTQKYLFNSPPTAPMTLYAKWDSPPPVMHTITYSDTTLSNASQSHGSIIIRPADPVKSGFTFGNWYSDSGLTTPYVFGTALNSDITIYAKWKPLPILIFYHNDGAVSGNAPVDNGMYVANDSVLILGSGTMLKPGYLLTAWNTKVDGTGTSFQLDTYAPVNSTLDLYPVWVTSPPDPVFYTINIYDNIDKKIIEKRTVEEGQILGPLTAPTHEYCTFVKWIDVATNDVITENTIITKAIEVCTVYNETQYDVVFEMNGHGTPLPPQKITHGQLIPTIPNQIEAGYTFGGWYLDSSFTEPFNNTSIKNNTFLYAKWIPITHIVRFLDYDKITVLKIEEVANGDAATTPTDPTREGYTFDHWNPTYDIIVADMDIIAIYKINNYAVEFIIDGDSKAGTITGMTSQSVSYMENGPSVTAIPNPGYHFVAWSDGITTLKRSVDKVTSNMILSAKFQIDSIPIMDDTGSTSSNTVSVVFDPKLGNSFKFPKAPIKAGYTCSKWKIKNTTGDVIEVDAEKDYVIPEKTAILSIQPVYVEDPIPQMTTVKLNTMGGGLASDGMCKYGTVITEGMFKGSTLAPKPNEPLLDKTGYNKFTFDGWYLDEQYGTTATGHPCNTPEITLYAKWKPEFVAYTPSTLEIVDPDTKEIVTKITVTDGGDLTIPTLPDRNGKKFIGLYEPVSPRLLMLPGRTIDEGSYYAYYVNTTTIVSGGGGGGGSTTVIKEIPVLPKLSGMTRQQITYFLLDCMNNKDKVKGTFSDCSDERIGTAQKIGLVKGYSNGTFKPNQLPNGQEIQILLERFITITNQK